MRRHSKERREMNYYSNMMVNKDMAKEVRLLGLSDTFIDKYKRVFAKYYAGIKRLIIKEGVVQTLVGLITTVATCGLFVFVAYSIIFGNGEIGDYSLYTGSHAQPDDRANFCQPTISMMISARDFENAVFRHFGGTTVQHRDGDVFQYLRDAGGYTAPVQAKDPVAKVRLISLDETEHTYRRSFRLVCEDAESEGYLAVFVKRGDSSCYFYSLRAL